MDIKELEDYRLSDAVKFHTHLNPRIWGSDEHLLPEVREKLLAIAADFKEFLGLDLEVTDITISGSNAAYTYTDHSDVDLHLVTDLPKADIGELYRELFDAKKYQYNDQHNFTIGGYPVELYVQNASLDHKSQGIYSVVDNDWVSVPRRRQPDIDDISVKSKYEDLGNRIESAIKSGDAAQLEMLGKKVREFRQAGLDQTGEFGPENLAFKVLRSNGTLDRLRAARQSAKNQELSIDEAGKKKKKKSFRYGFGGYYSPGYNYYGQTDAAVDGGADGGGESVKESTESQQDIIERFTRSCADLLGIKNVPKIKLRRDPQWTRINGTFGRYTADPDHRIELATHGRHIVDILRTLAHEMTHARQNEVKALPDNAGETGSEYEDSANAMAGRIMRHWAESEPHMFQGVVLEEGKLTESVVFLNPNTVIVGQDHSKPLDLSPETLKRVQAIAAKHGAWYEGNGKDRTYTKGQIDKYAGSWDDEVAKTVSPNDPKWLYVLFANVDENNRVQRIGVDAQDTIFNRLLATAKDNSFQNIGFTSQALQKFLSMASEGKYDFVKMSQQPATQENLSRFLKAGESLMWPGNWEQYPNKAGKIAKSATVDVRDQYLATRKAGVYVTGSGHLKAVQDITGQQVVAEVIKMPPTINSSQGMADWAYQDAQDKKAGSKGSLQGIASKIYDMGDHLRVFVLDEQGPVLYLALEKFLDGFKSGAVAVEPRGRGKNLAVQVYQAVSDTFGLPIYSDTTQTDASRIGIWQKLMTSLPGRVVGYDQRTQEDLPLTATDQGPAVRSNQPVYTQRTAKDLSKPVTGQNRSRTRLLKLLPSQKVVAEASGYIPVTDAEARDPRYSMAITQDIKPGEVKRQAAKMGWKTTAAGTPPTARTNGLIESLQRKLDQVKADTLTEQQLDEVNMSPGALQSWAKEHAGSMKAGFEAELIFRDQLDDQADDEGDMEPDYDADERADSIDDIIEFFSAEMGRRAQDELRREMYENYSEWQADSILEAFDNRIHVTIKEYLEENDWNWQEKIAEYLQDEMDKTAEESDAIMNQGEENDDGSENEDYVSAMQAVEDQLDKRIDLAVQEGNDNADWQGAYDDFAENFDNDEQDWLRSLGIRHMTDVDDHFSVDWPHWQSVDNGSSADGEYHRDTAELLATSLRNKFGVKTQVESSTRGDTAKRSTPGDVWVFEADGSLRPDDKTDMPVEIVSPPMPLKQTLAIMPEFFKWASSEGAYANKSTGLHMSVSMPEHAGDNLDYVKAALFLGDQYVLDQFGRAASTYSQSAIKEIKSKIDARRKSLIPADNLVTKAFEQMRTKLNSMATQAFARPSGFGKYFTINPKDKYIEFRSAGGKDYIEDIPKLQNTLLRYARAMSIGMDPAAEKQEYAKKLYKLLGNIELQKNPTGKVSVKPGEKDATWYFSQYVAGELTKERLKSAVKEIQQTRDIKKQAALGQQTYYEVTFRSGGDRVQKVMASSQKQAIALARNSWGIPARTHPGLTDDDFIAKATGPQDPLAPGQYSTRSQATDRNSFAYDPASDPAGNYVIRQRDSLGSDGTGPVIYRFNATGTSDAVDQTRAWMAQRGLNRLDVWLSQSENVPPGILNAAPNLDTIPLSQATPPGMPASTQEGNWAMRNRGADTSFSGSDGGGPILYQFQANSNSQAIDISRQYAEAIGVPRERLWLSMTSEVPAEYRTQPTQDTIIPPAGIANEDRTSATGYWVVFDGATGSNLDNLAFLPARSSQDAQLAYRQWYQRTGYMFGSDARFIMRPGDPIDVQDARDRGLPTPPPMPANLPQTLAPSSSDDAGRWQRTEWNIVDNDTGQVLHTFGGPGVTQGVANTMAAAWLEAEGPEDADMTEISVVPVPRSTIQDIPMDIAQNFIPGSTLDLQQQRQAAATPLRVRTTVGEPRPAFREPRANSIPEVPLDIAQNFQDPPASWDGGPPIETEPQNFPAARSTGGEFTGQWNIVNSNTGEIVHTFGGAGNVQADANQAAARWARQTRFDDPIEVYPQMR